MKPLTGLRAADTAHGRALIFWEIERYKEDCRQTETPWQPQWYGLDERCHSGSAIEVEPGEGEPVERGS
jgi:hypothetical protein